MLPADVQINDTVAFLTDALRGRSRVLEVGCGDGAVARRLGAAGHDVTAIDLALPNATPAPGVAFVEADFLGFDAPRFDAVVFTASLHHIAPLADAVARLRRLTAAGSVIVADDFDLTAPDDATTRWFYGAHQGLVADGVYAADHHGAAHADLHARWHAHHDHGLHTGAQMLRALGELGPCTATRVAYLYRYLCHGLPATAQAGQLAADLLARERAGIRDGTLVAVGLRLVATVA